MHKYSSNGERALSQLPAAHIDTWVVDESDRDVVADAVDHLGLHMRSVEATPSVFPASPGVVVDVLDVNSDAAGDSDLSDIPPSGVIDIRSGSARGPFAHSREGRRVLD